MLKRYQVLLSDWMAEHYKLVSKKYDVSFSEMIRMALCVDIMNASRITFPRHRWKVNGKLMKNVIKKKDIVDTMGVEKFHKFLSEIYFEARKATELWVNDRDAGRKGKHKQGT
ncbi:hypothetical protein ACFL42_01335 [Candidatus Omnitrophota bacterium]